MLAAEPLKEPNKECLSTNLHSWSHNTGGGARGLGHTHKNKQEEETRTDARGQLQMNFSGNWLDIETSCLITELH